MNFLRRFAFWKPAASDPFASANRVEELIVLVSNRISDAQENLLNNREYFSRAERILRTFKQENSIWNDNRYGKYRSLVWQEALRGCGITASRAQNNNEECNDTSCVFYVVINSNQYYAGGDKWTRNDFETLVGIIPGFSDAIEQILRTLREYKHLNAVVTNQTRGREALREIKDLLSQHAENPALAGDDATLAQSTGLRISEINRDPVAARLKLKSILAHKPPQPRVSFSSTDLSAEGKKNLFYLISVLRTLQGANASDQDIIEKVAVNATTMVLLTSSLSIERLKSILSNANHDLGKKFSQLVTKYPNIGQVSMLSPKGASPSYSETARAIAELGT